MSAGLTAQTVLAQTSKSESRSSAPESPSINMDLPDAAFQGKRSRDVLLAQVFLDRQAHSPGVIDGYPGGNTTRAVKAFQKSNGMKEDGMIDDALLRNMSGDASNPVLSSYTITSEDVSGPFKEVPATMAGMADRDALGYTSAEEMLAEKFHMSPGLLKALNPDTAFDQADTEIFVVARQSDSSLDAVQRIDVDKANAEVRAYGDGNKLLATFPATVGSSDFPSPSGTMKVRAIAAKPNYTFQPKDQKWGGDKALTLPPGPNNPVGSTWIDLGKDGYGIHGTPEPSNIGKTASHGCVRLTNWDAAALAKAVIPGTTEVVFN
jgi:lipoprotein-anchoring transpeptidase ErfK/SrfK